MARQFLKPGIRYCYVRNWSFAIHRKKINMANQNKTAIITGGGSGIGYAIAEKFVASGIRTIIIGRNQEKLKKAKYKLGKLCIPICFDITNLKSIPELVKQITKDHGVTDILVNNA